MLSHEMGRGQWMVREFQGTNRIIPDTARPLTASRRQHRFAEQGI